MEKTNKKIIILISSLCLIIISLIAVIGFLIIPKMLETDKEESKEEYKEVLKNIPVKVIYNEERYAIDGLPDTVNITLIGKKKDIKEIKELSNNVVSADLSEYKASEETIKIKLRFNNGDNVEYKIDPSSVEIQISNKISTIKKVSVDPKDLKIAGNLEIQTIESDREEVIARGSSTSLERIDYVKINLDTEEIKKEGKYTLENLSYTAYDAEGEPIPNIEIIPNKGTINITVVEKKTTENDIV